MNEFETKVNETVLSGIAPLQQRFVGVFDGYVECPEAYIAHTQLFSSASGTIDNVRDLIDNDEIGVRVTIRNLTHGIRTMQSLRDNGRTTSFIGIEASASLLKEEDVSVLLEEVVGKERFSEPERICFIFTPSIMSEDRDIVKKGLSDVKALGFMIAIAPVNADFAVSAMMDLPVDYVILSKDLTALATDRNKTGVLAAMIGLLHAMRIGVIADGVNDDDEIRELTTVECFGFIPTEEYTGEFLLKAGERTMEDILTDEEGV